MDALSKEIFRSIEDNLNFLRGKLQSAEVNGKVDTNEISLWKLY